MTTVEISENRTTARARVEEIATQAVVEPEGLDARSAIAELAGLAEQAGLPQVAARVRALPPSSDVLGDALAELQRALDESTAPAPEPSVAQEIASDPELMQDFILEAREHLTAIETQLLIVEKDPSQVEAIHTIFRGFHTIKGVAGFLELAAIQAVSHDTETVLDHARNGRLVITSSIADTILASADYVRRELLRLEARCADETPGREALLQRVRGIQSGETAAPAKLELPIEEAPVANAQHQVAVEARSVKVDTAKLDFLVDMVGEMVIAQSLIRHDEKLQATGESRMGRHLAQLSRITGEVQKTAMAMRMVPIGQLFQRSTRLVRDLSRKIGKRAELDLSGENTELDRNIVEALADPLMHMVRNSVDHGIEPPEDRVKAGKNPVARIHLKAYHQGGSIVIAVEDDGRGLNRQKILAKARERGLPVRDDMTDRDVYNLIMEPGFSTAEQITEVSGRGVGMDVVRKQVQKMRGRIDIESRPGLGSTFLLTLPLTLAIIDGLVVGVGEEKYIVPIYAIREIFRPKPEQIFTVEQRREMIMVRGMLLPLIRLYQRVGAKPRSTDPTETVTVVAECNGKDFGLMVDEVLGKQEVVIKSLGDMLQGLHGVAGGAILGDGRVGLILDMEGIFRIEGPRV